MAYADVTALLIAHLEPLIATPFFVDVPPDRPDTFTQIRRIGGPDMAPVRDRPHIDVIVRAPTAQQAMAILLDIRARVRLLTGTNTLGVTVYRYSEILGPKQMTDPETGSPMAMMTIELQVRADDAIQFTQ